MKTSAIDAGSLIVQPADPYDTNAWMAFYAAHPGWRRSVGAEGVNDDPKPDDKPKDPDDKKVDDKPKDPDPKPDDKKVDDEKASLIKDMMKWKDKAKSTEDQLAALKKDVEGLDLAAVRKLLADQAKAEEDAKLARGEFDAVKKQMVDAHDKALKEKTDALAEKDGVIAALQKQINDLAIGADFTNSPWLKKETILTGPMARTLFGEFFDVVDGKAVGYTKPRGAEGRAPISDAAGQPVSFEVAIQRVVEGYSEKDSVLRASLKPGAGSKPADKTVDPNPQKMSGLEMITAGLSELKKS